MAAPNNELIAEVLLFSEGFKYAKALGRKLVAVFNLSKQLLTPQQHYDWGLRPFKTVINGCGNLLQIAKKNGEEMDIEKETELCVQSMRINTNSKLTFADCIRFDALLKDIFPGVKFSDINYPELI